MALKDIKEIRTDHIDDDNLNYVDAWFDNDDNSQGTTIAVVCRDTKKVIFIDNAYRLNNQVKEAIEEIKKDIDAELGDLTKLYHDDAIKVATAYEADFPQEYEWLRDNMNPTYKDQVMREDLYNANIVDEMEGEVEDGLVIPDYIEKFGELLTRGNYAYVRFIAQ